MLSSNSRGTFHIWSNKTFQGGLTLSFRDQEQTSNLNGTGIRETVKHYRVRYCDPTGAYYITTTCEFNSLHNFVKFYSADANGLFYHHTLACPLPVPAATDLSARTNDQQRIPKTSVVLSKQLDFGQFGELWPERWNSTTEVAVKTLKAGTMAAKEFPKEARIMLAARHPMLVRPYALCRDDIHVVSEFMSSGGLLHCLRDGPGKNLETNALVDRMPQISSGNAFLKKENHIQREFVACKILVGENNYVQLDDLGLARVVETNYLTYMAHKSMKILIK